MKKEYKVGDKFTLEVVKTDTASCSGCFFNSKNLCDIGKMYPCGATERSDNNNVVFKEVK